MGSVELEAVLKARDMSRRVKDQYMGKYGVNGGDELSDTLTLFKDDVFAALERHKSAKIMQLMEESRTASACGRSSPNRMMSSMSPPTPTKGQGSKPHVRAKSSRRHADAKAMMISLEADAAAATALEASTVQLADAGIEEESPALVWAQVGESKDATTTQRFNTHTYTIRAEWDPKSQGVKKMARANTYYVDSAELQRRADASMTAIMDRIKADRVEVETGMVGGSHGALCGSASLANNRPVSATLPLDSCDRRRVLSTPVFSRSGPPPRPSTSHAAATSPLNAALLASHSHSRHLQPHHAPSPSLPPRSRPVSAVYANVRSRLFEPTSAFLTKCSTPAGGAPPTRVQSARPAGARGGAGRPGSSLSAAPPLFVRSMSESGRGLQRVASEDADLDVVTVVPLSRFASISASESEQDTSTIKPGPTFGSMLKSYEDVY